VEVIKWKLQSGNVEWKLPNEMHIKNIQYKLIVEMHGANCKVEMHSENYRVEIAMWKLQSGNVQLKLHSGNAQCTIEMHCIMHNKMHVHFNL